MPKCPKCKRTLKSKGGLTTHLKTCGVKKVRKFPEPRDPMELVIRTIQRKYDIGTKMESFHGGKSLQIHTAFSEIYFWISPQGQLFVTNQSPRHGAPRGFRHFCFGEAVDDIRSPEWDPEFLIEKAGEFLKAMVPDLNQVAKNLGCTCKKCLGKIKLVPCGRGHRIVEI